MWVRAHETKTKVLALAVTSSEGWVLGKRHGCWQDSVSVGLGPHFLVGCW